MRIFAHKNHKTICTVVKNMHRSKPLIAENNELRFSIPESGLTSKPQSKAQGASFAQDAHENTYPGLRKAAQYVAYTIGAAYIYDKTTNHFFLSTTALHDGKQGFTSNMRLVSAEEKAEEYHHAFHKRKCLGLPTNTPRSLLPKLCGENLFLTMLDFRSATKVHLKHRINTPEARTSIEKNISCIMGMHIKADLLDAHSVKQVPLEFDLTKNPNYDLPNKYSLSGVANEDSGSYGYASRSITHPFIEKGAKHHQQSLESEHSLSPKKCIDTLQSHLQNTSQLPADVQFLVGQTLLILRPLYCAKDNWGDAHKVLMPFLQEEGLITAKENQRLGATRPFHHEDLEKGIARRNTSIAGPFFNKLNSFLNESIYRKDKDFLDDLHSKKLSEIHYIPISHIKMNEKLSSIEDASGLSDSFTGFNVSAYINHARLLSGEDRLSLHDVIVIVGCLNAIYDNSGSERHSLREIAHGCFVGAGYTIEDAEAFYNEACKAAAAEFYGGKAIASKEASAQTS